MTEAQRAELVAAAQRFEQLAESGNVAALRPLLLTIVADQYDSIAAGMSETSASLKGTNFTPQNLFLLDASDLASAADTQFFCGLAGTPLTVTFDFPGLQPGRYAVVLAHAYRDRGGEQLAFILGREPGRDKDPWKLGGFYARPLAEGGHDGVWYWRQARDLSRKNERFSAYFYYQTARYLLTPIDFMTTPNLDKLQQEMAAVTPSGLPGALPMMVPGEAGASYAVTGIRTDATTGALDLVLRYRSAAAAGEAQRTEAVAFMKAFLKQYPEVRSSFHGLWVYAEQPGGPAFSLELPMEQIR
jgi:hypothetical protein